MVAINRIEAECHSVVGAEIASNVINTGTALKDHIEIRHIERNHDIFLEGEHVDGLFVLQEGWAYRYRLLDDGRRFISGFLIDGDLIGPFTVAASHFVATLTDATIGRASKERLRALIAQSPDLVAAVTNAMTEEHEMLSQRALNLARCNAKERMAQLLLELSERTRRAGLSDGLSFKFPVSQEIMADCLGLSIVHVNRTLRCLREERIALVGYGTVNILDYPRLCETAGSEPPTSCLE